jgi:WD40 repeat protein/serine/threonine protein kinase/tetratricopeptide (TPR) repeat protein
VVRNQATASVIGGHFFRQLVDGRLGYAIIGERAPCPCTEAAMSADKPNRSASAPDMPGWVNDLLMRFEATWQAGAWPAVEDFLPADPDQRRPALVPLLCCDLERRLRRGQPVRVEDYLERFPELGQDVAGLYELVSVEYELVRRRLGVGLDDYLRRFPQFADRLREQFPPEEPTNDRADLASQATQPPGEADGPAPVLPPLRYKPVQLHAQGNLGEVLRAQDEELNREIALKRILERHADNADSRRRFLREAEVTARLEHPGVVPVHGLGQDADGRPCYAMRFIQGASLKEAIERFHAADKPGRDPGERRLALRQLLTSFVTVCKTVAYAHSRGILHRDLKPANVMMGKYGETLVVDWGLAKAFDRDETARSLGEQSLTPGLAGGGGETQMGQMVGTPAYASPEQASGHWDVVGPASDIYSLGAMLYNLLTNALPYEGSGVLEIIEQASKGQVIPPRQRKKDVPRPLEAICLKAMAHKREARYAAALELATDVEDWLADEPVSAHRESLVERLMRVGRRHRAAVVAGAALILAVGAVAVALVLANARNIAEEERALAEEARKQEQSARQTAEEKTELADQAKGEAEAQRKIAERAKEAVEAAASHLRVANGVQSWDQGEHFVALLWFAKALAGEKRGPEFEALHRWRLGAALAQCPRLVQVWHHQSQVIHATFSPDGGRVVTASNDQTARIWDAASGHPVTPPLKHNGTVLYATFSPDGRRVVTASWDQTAQVWDAATGQPVTPPLKHDGEVWHATFSPDSRRVVTASHDKTARVWDAASGQRVMPRLKHNREVYHATFSPDGRHIVSASFDKTARVWDAATGQPVAPPLMHNGEVWHATFSPDGRRVVTASQDGMARVWDAASGQPVTPPLKHNGGVRHATFSPDGCRVVTASEDRTARVWDAANGQPVTLPLKHNGALYDGRFSSDGRRVVTASQDGTARVWDAANGQPVTPPLKHNEVVRHAMFSPDGHRVVTASEDGTARVWDAASDQPITPPLIHISGVWHATFKPDSRRLVSAGWDGKAWVWALASGLRVTASLKHNGYLTHVELSPDGRRVSACGDSTARVWDAASGRPVTPPLTHNGQVSHVTFSPDGRRVVTASNDGTARLWDAASGQPVTPPLKHKGLVYHATFSPDGRRVVTASSDGTARVWDAANGQPVTPPLKHNEVVGHATFSPDGHRVVTVSWKEARVWDAATGQPVTPPLKHVAPVKDATFSPDGGRVVTASDDQTARVWEAAGGLPVTPPLKHNGEVWHATFSPDGRRVVTASQDGMARVWDAASGQPLTPSLKHGGFVPRVTFSPDGRRVVTASPDGTVRVWDLPLDERPAADLIQLAEVLAGYRLDEQSGVVPLDRETRMTAWKTLRQRYPAQFTSTKEEIAAWHREEARACAEAQLWAGAILHLNSLIETDPTNREFRSSRGQAHAALRHWAEGATDFGKSLEGEADLMEAGWHALCLAGAGEWAAHRQACGRLLERFGKEDDRKTANDVAWHGVRFREGSPDPSQPLKLAEQAVAASPQDPNVQKTLGAALYRAGRYADAIKKLEEGIRLQNSDGTPEDWLFLALAHQRLKHADEAKKWLTKAQQWLDQAKDEKPGGATLTWDRRLELQLIRAEAEALVGKGQ